MRSGAQNNPRNPSLPKALWTWTGHAGCAWVLLEKWCLLEWALRRGISPLPLKRWAVGSGFAAGAASTPLSQIRPAKVAPEAAHNIC